MYKWRYWDISNVDIEKYNIRLHNPELKDKFNHSIQGDYYQGVEAAYQYAYDVLSGKKICGQSEIAACERFVYDLHRDDLVFDEGEIEFVLIVANCLRHPKGPLAGQPFYLLPFMIFILSQMYGFYYSNKARETLIGERRFHKTFWAVARGNSKTVVGAIASIVNMLTNENGAPIGTCSATIQKQSRIAFEDISNMIRSASPSIKKRFNLLQNEIRVIHNNGKIFPTSKQANTLDGIRVAGLALCDEIHAHTDSSIVDVLATGMASSKNPQLLMITTAGFDTQGYGREMFEYADEIVFNHVENDRFLAVMYKADKEDEDNWADERVWHKANPAIGHAVNLESLRAGYAEATRNAKARANFMVKHLNIFVDFDEDNFIEANELFECRDQTINISSYEGKTCYLGLDLAGVSDLSSLVYIFPEVNGGVTVFQKSYLPESAIRNAKPVIQDRYYKSQQDGELIITLGDVTDFEYIKSDIVDAYERFKVEGFSIDGAAGGIRFASELEEQHSILAVSVKQGFGLSETSTMLLNLIKSKKFKYNDSLLEWCYINAQKVEGTYGDLKVVRPKADNSKKIDICVATLIGLSQTILQENQYSIYEHQDVRFL
ncbi:terminase large subunit [Vibrio parahaemolyticus]|nr:terminase large subunit [Vibrio parahaemolyticus]